MSLITFCTSKILVLLFNTIDNKMLNSNNLENLNNSYTMCFDRDKQLIAIASIYILIIYCKILKYNSNVYL